jgi:hypothetical protein
MSQFSNSVLAAATKAVYEFQLNTERAARFVCAEVPHTPFAVAAEAIAVVAQPTR